MAYTVTTQYGFNFGPAVVERLCSDDKKGWEGSGRSQTLGLSCSEYSKRNSRNQYLRN